MGSGDGGVTDGVDWMVKGLQVKGKAWEGVGEGEEVEVRGV